MFNYSYYARWFFMPLLIMALMTVMALKGRKCNFLDGMKWTAVIIGVFSLIGIIPSSWQQNEEAKNVPAKETALIYLGIFLVFLSIAILLYTNFAQSAQRKSKTKSADIYPCHRRCRNHRYDTACRIQRIHPEGRKLFAAFPGAFLGVYRNRSNRFGNCRICYILTA